MLRLRSLVLLLAVSAPVFADSTPVIFRGRVTMADGSAPGKSVGTQRNCTDGFGNAPGPLTDKDGKFTWRMDVNFMGARRCFILATLNGFESTQVEISNVNPSTGVNVDLAPVKLSLKGGDPYQLGGADKDVPSKGSAEWNNAMKAVNASDVAGAMSQLKAATASNPKFALAWHNLGILHDFQRNYPDAIAAYNNAIEANPKLLTPYVALARVQTRQGDWAGIGKTVASFLPLDKSIIFPEMHLHLAVAQYKLKDLAAAEASATAALNPKAKQSAHRAEYVLGRILEAKGDTAGAKQHMNHYLELVPDTEDAAAIKAHMEKMGQAGAPEPELEVFK